MKDVVEVLEFVKVKYKDKTTRQKIDNAISILNGGTGLKSQKVVDILKALQIAYDDAEMKVKIGQAIKILEV